MNTENLKELEDTLWKSADKLRANSALKSTEYSTPVLGLIFLKFADNKYSRSEKEINREFQKLKGTRREKPIHEIAIEKCGFYLPPEARYDYLKNLPESEPIAEKIKEAMAAIETYLPELQGVLPQDEYFRLTQTDPTIPKTLLKDFSSIPADASGDMFGQIYEYFLGKFAMSEGQRGGEFFTPRSVVRLMVEIIEPHKGTVFDPACGSGGMFVQSAQFVEQRRKALHEDGMTNLFVYGQEKTLETVKLAKMNIAINGLRGDIRQSNTYYEDVFHSFERFDYVLANPPFNVDDVNLSKIKKDPRFATYGLPRNKSKVKKEDKELETVPNANYLWINLFAASLKPGGRAGLVMANSASDARHSEADIRKTLVRKNLIYAMVTLPSNMFYTVTLPATLWFFDRGKTDDRILFIDARNIFTHVDRAHREFSAEQVRNIALISALHRGRRQSFVQTVNDYFEQGMEKLKRYKPRLQQVANTLTAYLAKERANGLPDMAARMEEITELEAARQRFVAQCHPEDIDDANGKQRELAAVFTPFFRGIHEMLKVIDRRVREFETKHGNSKEGKAVKGELAELHREIKEAEYFFTHIDWLQERFPGAAYEDVTGLCKSASPEEVEEQDYSLNPGRYVGVVIEEDGKTEEEFIDEILTMNEELNRLNKEAIELAQIIDSNIKAFAGEE